jgi:pimeloyl-ACP methyl ester carboxylesterase
MRAVGEAGFTVPVMAWGGEFGVPVTHAQFDAIPGETAGGIIPGAGHLLPEEVPEVLAQAFDAFFSAAEAR